MGTLMADFENSNAYLFSCFHIYFRPIMGRDMVLFWADPADLIDMRRPRPESGPQSLVGERHNEGSVKFQLEFLSLSFHVLYI